jgi:flavin-dependent dehydrogenase
MNCYDVIIVGGGLAGLTASLHMAMEGHSVCVFEKAHYPNHKVCGEYVSNEIVPYLHKLGIFLADASAVEINTLMLSSLKGRSIEVPLPLGGKGISRYAFDNLLYQRAKALGVHFEFKNVKAVTFENDGFEVHATEAVMARSKVVIGAYGKRSALDKNMDRKFISQNSPWIGVKAHYRFDEFPDNLVALHTFEGGYGGLSKTENGNINFCYLANYKYFKKYKDIDHFNQNIVSKNPFLSQFLGNAKMVFETPLAIAQISFEPKACIENHMLMCGDAAGLIHPLCGNGMAMAIHSAKLAAENVSLYLSATHGSRGRMEQDYRTQWHHYFNHRMMMGRRLQKLLLNPTLSQIAMTTVAQSSWLLQKIVGQTHGKPILC